MFPLQRTIQGNGAFPGFIILLLIRSPHHNLQAKHLLWQIQASWFKIFMFYGFELVTMRQQIGVKKQVCQWYLQVVQEII